MPRLRLLSKLLPLLLIVAVFCAACDVPDISEFSKQSAEMTRGIRKGVKDTEGVIKTAAERDDLYSDETIETLNAELKNYQRAVKPTVASLDALDAYLEALNALAQANDKSEENSRGAVNAVSNLVTAVSGFTFASSVVNVATGLLTVAEEFRTSKDFKKRVTLAAEIVEGVYLSRDEDGKPKKNEKGQPIFLRTCTENAGDRIVEYGKAIKDIVDPKLATLDATQTKTLKPLSPEKRREKLRDWGKLSSGDLAQIKQAERQIAAYHCGVIDFIKFNLMDLREINNNISDETYTNAREKNRVVLGFYESVVANDLAVQNELDRILNYTALIRLINQQVNNGAEAEAVKTKVTLKNTLDSIFILDPGIKMAAVDSIRRCRDCGAMLTVLLTQADRSRCNAACRATLIANIRGISRLQFEKSESLIQPILDKRAAELTKQNDQYLAQIARLKPSYEAVNAELKGMKERQNQLDNLLETSLSALDSWAETHANLRVAVNTKKPLSAAKLASKVKEIWAILRPETD